MCIQYNATRAECKAQNSTGEIYCVARHPDFPVGTTCNRWIMHAHGCAPKEVSTDELLSCRLLTEIIFKWTHRWPPFNNADEMRAWLRQRLAVSTGAVP